jgi:hypothetical protein
MPSIESDIEEYLLWLSVHNYATTTIGDRRRYLGYLVGFLAARQVTESTDVTSEDLKAYQEFLFCPWPDFGPRFWPREVPTPRSGCSVLGQRRSTSVLTRFLHPE